MKPFLRVLYQPYKWLVYVPVFLLDTLFIASLSMFVAFINPVIASRYPARWWAKFGLLPIPAKVNVVGGENISKGTSYIVVANHISLIDILAIYGWLDLDLKWVMKKEVRKVPIIGPACAAMGHVFLDRSKSQVALKALEDVKKTLPEGTSIMFFPEGTRSENGKMRHFKRGAFMMAKALAFPVLPVTIVGTEKILPNGSVDLLPGKIDLVIHPEIPLEEVKLLSEAELINKAQTAVKSALVE